MRSLCHRDTTRRHHSQQEPRRADTVLMLSDWLTDGVAAVVVALMRVMGLRTARRYGRQKVLFPVLAVRVIASPAIF